MEVINFYTQPKVKKYLVNAKDEQKQYTGMPLRKHILVCALTNSGKTNLVCNYIYQSSLPEKGTFKHIFIVHKKEEELLKFLQEELKDNLTCFKGVEELPRVTTFPDMPKEQYLLIFDDCITDKDRASKKKVEEYFTYGRSKGITLMFIAQSYFDTLPYIRKQVAFTLLLSVKGKKDFNLITTDFETTKIDREKIAKMYDYALTKKYDNDLPFLKVNCEKCPDDKKFSRNFLDYLDPDKF